MKLTEQSSLFLDFLRAFSAQVVVVFHAASLFGLINAKQQLLYGLPSQAVVTFFILSGFLIAYSTFNRQKNSEYSFSKYFKSRFKRIYSTLIPVIILAVLIDYFTIVYFHNNQFKAYTLQNFIGNILMLQNHPLQGNLLPQSISNFINVNPFGTSVQLWSLSIEWWCYMLFGWLMLGYNPHKKFVYFFLLLLLSIIPIANAGFLERGKGITWCWFEGVSVFFFLNLNKKYNLKIIYLILIGSLLFFMGRYYNKGAYDMLASILFTIFFASAIYVFQNVNFKFNDFVKRIIKFFVGYSYTLFLLHYCVICLLINVFSSIQNKFIVCIISIIISNALAYLLSLFTEKDYRLK